MAIFARVNGKAEQFGGIGRTVQLMSFSKTDITQTELDSLVNFIQLTNTVTGISEFEAGTTDVAYMLIEGPSLAGASSFGGVTGVTGAVVETFITK